MVYSSKLPSFRGSRSMTDITFTCLVPPEVFVPCCSAFASDLQRRGCRSKTLAYDRQSKRASKSAALLLLTTSIGPPLGPLLPDVSYRVLTNVAHRRFGTADGDVPVG